MASLPVTTSSSPEAVIVANNGAVFYVPRNALCAASPVAAALLGDAGARLPLSDSERATPAAVALLARWLHRRSAVPPSPIEVPTPSAAALDDLFDDPWDAAFVRDAGSVTADYDVDDFDGIYGAVLLGTALRCDAFVGLCAACIAFCLRWRVRRTADPLGVVAEWLGCEDGKVPGDVAAMEAWLADAMTDATPPPHQPSFDADAWLASLPQHQSGE
jgi:hypothetical protein